MAQDVAIVLSGGGSYLYAHIGVLEALEDAGLLNDRQNDFAQHNQVKAVVGTSAGSLVGSFLATGYPPHEIWKLAYWRIWNATPPDDSNQTATNAVKPNLAEILDIDWDGISTGLTTNLNRFKGLVRGQGVIELLARYQYIQKGARSLFPNSEYEQLPYILSPQQRKELYLIACNLSNGRETIFQFSEHLQPVAPSALLAIPALGREVNYALYHDAYAEGLPPEQVMTIPEAIRCSVSIPAVFRPYYKLLRYYRSGKPQMIGAYYTDGGSRDNYGISVGVKVAECKRIFGVYLGDPDYSFQPAGPTSLATLMLRIINGLMMQTIYEADQDDGEIMQVPVRTVVPVMENQAANDTVLDARIAVAARRAGYIAGAYCLYCVRRALDGTPVDPGDFVGALLDRGTQGKRQPLVTWDELFSEEVEKKLGEPAPGRTFIDNGGKSPLSTAISRYYILSPRGDDEANAFYKAAMSVFEARYGNPLPGIRAAGEPAGDLIDTDYPALDKRDPNDPVQAKQAQIVQAFRLAARIILTGLIFTLAIVIASLILEVTGGSLSLLWVVALLIISFAASSAVYGIILEFIWDWLQIFIKNKLAA